MATDKSLLVVTLLAVAGMDMISGAGRPSVVELKQAIHDLDERVTNEIKVQDNRLATLENMAKNRDENPAVGNFILHNAGVGMNLAFGKAARQSSTAHVGEATAAVDGNLSGVYDNGSCTHTVKELNPWWSVDFGSSLYIGRVVIKNREDCCGERLRKFNIDVRESPSVDWKTVAKYPGISQNGELVTLKFETVLAQTLRIQIQDDGWLTLCEVQVFYE